MGRECTRSPRLGQLSLQVHDGYDLAVRADEHETAPGLRLVDDVLCPDRAVTLNGALILCTLVAARLDPDLEDSYELIHAYTGGCAEQNFLDGCPSRP